MSLPCRSAGVLAPPPTVTGRSADALGDLAGLDAAGADVQALRGAVDDGPDLLDVGVPPTLGATVRVADVHPEGRVLPAHLAHSCHRSVTSHIGTGLSDRSQDPERLPGRRE